MTNDKNRERIRNLPKFITAYLNSETGRRALNRQPKYTEHSAKNSRGHVVHWRELAGVNSIAHALAAAVNFQPRQ